MRKPRADSILKSLPEERQEQIMEWINTPKSETCSGGYQFAREQLGADGIKVSVGTLSEFYSWYGLLRFFAEADRDAREQESLMRSFNPEDADRARKWGEFCFMQSAARLQDPKAFAMIANAADSRRSLDLKAQFETKKLELAERRVHVLEQQHAKAAETLQDTTLTPEQQAQRMREIFGIA